MQNSTPSSPSSRAADVTVAASAIIESLQADVDWHKNALAEKSKACRSYQWMLDDMENQRDLWRFIGILAMVSLVLTCATSLALRYL